MKKREANQRDLILHATLIHGAAALMLLLMLLLRLESLVHVPERTKRDRRGKHKAAENEQPSPTRTLSRWCAFPVCAVPTDMIPTPTSSPPCRLP